VARIRGGVGAMLEDQAGGDAPPIVVVTLLDIAKLAWSHVMESHPTCMCTHRCIDCKRVIYLLVEYYECEIFVYTSSCWSTKDE
jgi:hypothetical protein